MKKHGDPKAPADKPVDAVILKSSTPEVHREKRITLPCSAATRGARYRFSYCKLLNIVRDTMRGYGALEFNGVLLPHLRVAEGALHPDVSYPERPIVLEAAGPVAGSKGGRQSEHLWVLWRRDGNDWTEIARTIASDNSWMYTLGPVAKRELARQGCGKPIHQRNLTEISGRLARILEMELEALPPEDRGQVASVIHDLLAAKVSRWLSGDTEGPVIEVARKE